MRGNVTEHHGRSASSNCGCARQETRARARGCRRGSFRRARSAAAASTRRAPRAGPTARCRRCRRRRACAAGASAICRRRNRPAGLQAGQPVRLGEARRDDDRALRVAPPNGRDRAPAARTRHARIQIHLVDEHVRAARCGHLNHGAQRVVDRSARPTDCAACVTTMSRVLRRHAPRAPSSGSTRKPVSERAVEPADVGAHQPARADQRVVRRPLDRARRRPRRAARQPPGNSRPSIRSAQDDARCDPRRSAPRSRRRPARSRCRWAPSGRAPRARLAVRPARSAAGCCRPDRSAPGCRDFGPQQVRCERRIDHGIYGRLSARP